MRIHIKIKSMNMVIPFDHQHLLTGVIHKWMGFNQVHGDVSLYSFSQLTGAKSSVGGLKLENETSFFFSAYDLTLVKLLVAGIQNDPSMFNKLEVDEIIIQEDPDLSNRESFFPASPVFIKRRLENNIEHILYHDHRANDFLKETLITKMKKVGLNDVDLKIFFDSNWPLAKTKLIRYKEVNNKVSWCPVIIQANEETKLFAWNVGLGNSTGIGFGAIK